jgi:hypothetical protein
LIESVSQSNIFLSPVQAINTVYSSQLKPVNATTPKQEIKSHSAKVFKRELVFEIKAIGLIVNTSIFMRAKLIMVGGVGA